MTVARPFVRVVIVVLVLIAVVVMVLAAEGRDADASPPGRPDVPWSLSSLDAALDGALDGRWYQWAAEHPPPPRGRALAVEASGGAGETVSSTAYCLTGAMADGSPARAGAVAANAWPLGTRLRVSPSPVGEVVVVEDRIGSGSQLDFALPGDCAGARAWGRRAVSVEVLSDG